MVVGVAGMGFVYKVKMEPTANMHICIHEKHTYSPTHINSDISLNLNNGSDKLINQPNIYPQSIIGILDKESYCGNYEV